MATVDELFDQALALPADDRLTLIAKLQESLPLDGFESPEIAAAWGDEIERRIEAYERGEATAEDADVVLARMKARFLESQQLKAPS